MDGLAQWLNDLKVGDEIAITRPDGTPRITRVERVTTNLITAGKIKFRKRDGRTQGDGWHKWQLEPVTDEIRTAVEDANLCTWLRRLVDARENAWPTLKQLRAMRAAYDQEGGE